MTLSRQDGTVSDQTRQRLLDVSAEQGERLRNMFEQVLTTSQLESGSFPIVPSEFDPRELLQTAAEAARYYRLDPGLRSGVAGTGLGLYVCRQLANRMGGHLDLEPHEGQGSTFTLTLPLNASA